MKEEIEVENQKDFLPEQEQLQKEFQDQQKELDKKAETEIDEKEEEPEPSNKLYLLQENLIIPIIEGKITFEVKEGQEIVYTENEKLILQQISQNIENRHSTSKLLSNDVVDVLTLLFIHGPKFYIKFKDKIKNLKKTDFYD